MREVNLLITEANRDVFHGLQNDSEATAKPPLKKSVSVKLAGGQIQWRPNERAPKLVRQPSIVSNRSVSKPSSSPDLELTASQPTLASKHAGASNTPEPSVSVSAATEASVGSRAKDEDGDGYGVADLTARPMRQSDKNADRLVGWL